MNEKTATPIRSQGPVGFRTAGPDGPLVKAARRKADGSPGWTLAIATVALLTGVLALLDTDITLRALAILVGISSIGQGVLRLSATHRNPGTRSARLREHVMATALIGVGLVCLLVPALGERGLLVGTAVWFVIVGLQELLGPPRRTRVVNVALFVASIAVALALVLNAEAGLSLLARLIAIGLLVRGLLLVTRAIVAGSPGRAPDAY